MPVTSLREAAFFDVDGTIVRTNIVHYYVYFRRRQLPAFWRDAWYAAFLIRCLYFLVLDRISRIRLNVAFYRHYRGRNVADILGMVEDCQRDIIVPRLFPDAEACIAEHQRSGRMVVLVTGSVDFIMSPLARRLGVEHVLAPTLVQQHGRFTGALDGPPVAEEEKARRMRRLAEEQGIDLVRSHAYGDSAADLPMLRAVGFAHAVNPDGALLGVAREKGWPVHHWRIRGEKGPAV